MSGQAGIPTAGLKFPGIHPSTCCPSFVAHRPSDTSARMPMRPQAWLRMRRQTRTACCACACQHPYAPYPSAQAHAHAPTRPHARVPPRMHARAQVVLDGQRALPAHAHAFTRMPHAHPPIRPSPCAHAPTMFPHACMRMHRWCWTGSACFPCACQHPYAPCPSAHPPMPRCP
jgi:hypothetical protein